VRAGAWAHLLLEAVASAPAAQMVCTAVIAYRIDVRFGAVAGWVYVLVLAGLTLAGGPAARRVHLRMLWEATIPHCGPRCMELAEQAGECFAEVVSPLTPAVLVIVSQCDDEQPCVRARCNDARLIVRHPGIPGPVLLIGERLAASNRLRFVLAHEAGHLRPVFPAVTTGMFLGSGAFTGMFAYGTRFGLRGLFTCTAIIYGMTYCVRWLEELRCDRRAVRCAGPQQAREALAGCRAIARASRRRHPWPARVIITAGYLLHPARPPYLLRLAVAGGRRRVTASG